LRVEGVWLDRPARGDPGRVEEHSAGGDRFVECPSGGVRGAVEDHVVHAGPREGGGHAAAERRIIWTRSCRKED